MKMIPDISIWHSLAIVCLTGCLLGQADNAMKAPNRGEAVAANVERGPAGGVTVYHKMFFNEGTEGWMPANDGRIRLDDDAIDGKALHLTCDRRWAGAQHAISVVGSRDLKIAALMKTRNLPSVGINVYDVLAGDNTTAYGYRYLEDDRWAPVLYRLDRFRYNSRTEGFVSAKTAYRSVSFYGPSDAQPGMTFAIDNFVMYRGTDKQPPDRVTGLKAKATADGVLLTWNPVADNVATQLYVISRANGGDAFEKIAESHTTSYLDTTAGNGTCRYRVFAVDFEENYGPWSAPVSVESISAARHREPTREERDRFVYSEHARQVHARGVGKVRKGHATLFGDSLTGATSYRHCAESAFRTLTANAFGYPSMRTSFGREKVHEILQKDNPEFMFILYGTNNNKAEKHIPAAMDDLAAIVKACEDRGTVAVLGTIPPRGWTPESAPEANFNRHVVELCRRLQIPVGYIFEDFQAAGDRRRHISGDGVHWTGSGMAVAAKAWGRTLDQIRFALRDQK